MQAAVVCQGINRFMDCGAIPSLHLELVQTIDTCRFQMPCPTPTDAFWKSVRYRCRSR